MFIETLRCLNLTGVTYVVFTVIKLNIELAALVAKKIGCMRRQTEAEDLHGESLAQKNFLQAGKRVENLVVTGGRPWVEWILIYMFIYLSRVSVGQLSKQAKSVCTEPY